MAAGTWQVFNLAKKKIGAGTISFPGTYRMALFSSTSNLKTTASARPLILLGSVSQQVGSGNGYSSSGKTITGETWTVGASAKSYHFDIAASGVVWTGTGGTIANIRFAAIYASGASAGACHLLCYATLTTAQFTLAANNTLTIKAAATGILTLA
jgi:hypothetical protein